MAGPQTPRRIMIGDAVEVVASRLRLPPKAGLHAFDGSSGKVIQIGVAKRERILQVDVVKVRPEGREQKLWVPEPALKLAEASPREPNV
jgi:hypothetical protein